MDKIPSEADIYKKVKILGQGANGKAYLVICTVDNKYYVMKRIITEHLS